MPLLRGKQFRTKTPPESLTQDDEVFFFELTEEIFTDYDEFFERVILCSSLLWTCECTGRNGLTYKEAKESEESVRKALRAIPDPTKRAVLHLVHQARRSRISDLCEEIMDYLRNRYQEGEFVEVKVKDQWKRAKVEKVHINISNTCSNSTPKKNSPDSEKTTPKKTPNKADGNNSENLSVNKSAPVSSDDYTYEIKVGKVVESATDTQMFQGKQVRRPKGSLTKDLLRLLLRQTCRRTTAASDDGYWIVEPEYVAKFSLGLRNIETGPLSLETPLKLKNKRKRSSGKQELNDDNLTPSKKRKSSDGSLAKSPDGKKLKKGKGSEKPARKSEEKKKKSPSKALKDEQKMKDLTPAQRKKLLEKQKLKEIAQKEKLKKKKLIEKEKEKERMKKEKEEEKQKRKVEKEREKERTTEIRKFEGDFLKEWSRIRDDLKLEDLKELPETKSIHTKFEGDLFGDAVMIVEFLNTFGAFYDIKDSIQQDITYDFVEAALHEHDAEGAFYDIVKFLLKTFFTVSKEENEEEANDDDSTHGTNTPEEPDIEQEQFEATGHSHVSSNATAAAAWSMLHQGMTLDELTIDPFTLSEILRLHILSSGVKIGGLRSVLPRKGGFQFSDDPCVDFRHTEKSILTTLHTSCLYDLSVQDKLKVLCVLCNQILTLTTTRDYIEDSFEKVKELKKKLRDLQNTEHKRRKLDTAERWRKKVEERARRKEEIEKRKKEKAARENEAKAEEAAPDGNKASAKKKRGRKRKNEGTKVDSTDGSQSQELKTDQDVEKGVDLEPKKEDQTEGEHEIEIRKREEYKKHEQEIIDEIAKHSSIRSVAPLGLDRIYSRYWLFKHVDGLFVEADEEGRKLAEDVGNELDDETIDDFNEDSVTKGDDDSIVEKEQDENKPEFPVVSLNDIIELRNSGKPFLDMLFTKYRCRIDEDRRKLICHSKVISLAVENVENGINPHIYGSKSMPIWSAYGAEGSLDDLINGLTPRGMREFKLKGKLEKITETLCSSIRNCALFADKEEENSVKIRPVKDDVVDKSLFRTIEDFLEANLRDQLLDFEERLWQASLGIIKVESREKWREEIASRINNLLWGKEGPTELDSDKRNIVEAEASIKVEQNENMQSEDVDMKQVPLENGVATDGVATDGVAMDGVATAGVATAGVATAGVAMDGVATDGVATAGVATAGVAMDGVATDGVATAGVATAGVAAAGVATAGVATAGIATAGVATAGVATAGVATAGEDGKQCESKMEVDHAPEIKAKQNDVMDSEPAVDSAESVNISLKSLPVKFIEQNKENSRCSTPINVSTPMINPRVRVLASILQQIERGIDPKYLKQPLGEDEATKRERIREMIEAANADFNEKSDKHKREGKKKPAEMRGEINGNENQLEEEEDKKSVTSEAVSEESLRKEITSLERWETSLIAAANFSQIFIHLNTLDRSVMWDKSVLNARCRICRKKGDAEKMLLCDGCDRGSHMYCLKPPVKKIPEGDWFCMDCRPKEPKRTQRPRKRPTKLEEFVEDIEEDQATEESDEEENDSESEEEASEEESEAESVDEHDDFCAICEELGDLLCCDICSRAFHINCVYPPMRKVPRGDWSCQVCTGADLDLPKARRVATKERDREKRRKSELKNERAEKSARVSDMKRHSSPGPARNKRQVASAERSGKRRKSSSAATRNSIGDPATNSSRRKLVGFGRYERRLCSKIIEELITAEDGEPFILPVDTRVVPDYLEFIDNPMDLSKIKQRLNDGSYDALQPFMDDVRLIFSNCETYNPPRSGVARAGSRLSIYFEQRLRELELIKM